MRMIRFACGAASLALLMSACTTSDSAGDTEDGTGTDTDTTSTSTTTGGTSTTSTTSTTGTGTTTTATTGTSSTTDDSATSGSTGDSTGGATDGSTGGSTGENIAESCFMITDETQCDNASNCQWFGQGQLGVCGDAGTGSGICDLVLTENICDIVPGCAWNAGNMACEGA